MSFDYQAQAQLHVDPAQVELFQQELKEHLNKHSAPVRWQYLIPELGEGGACSLFGHLQDEPFDLGAHIHQTQSAQLSALQSIVDFVVARSQVDWFGIYQSRHIEGEYQLLKLAYEGAPSRPLFPINDAFAATSNNVQVAMSGHARVINDVPKYVANGGEYYTCDPKVKAESCLPLFDNSGKVVGIIDAEAFNNEFFTPEILALLVAACQEIVAHLPK